ncbi:MAG: DMT family transporter [Candidatus Lambdaproteobacteria bacterium]|nr:DMT family transporter [Candidatus Lambdaproteobacteria bacterium]
MSAAHGGQPGGSPLVAPRDVDLAMVLWMLALTALWGFNAVTVKVLVAGMAPIMSLAVRGALALGPLTLLGWWRGESFRYRGLPALHLIANGLVVGLEFILIYIGARFTTGGRLAIFLNTAPFFTAVGAHFLLGERLHAKRVSGLLLAFLGILALFGEELLGGQRGYWRGDLLVMGAALTWALSTLHMKRFLIQDYGGYQLLYLPIVITTPLYYLASLLAEPVPFPAVTGVTVAILLFQALLVVSFSYIKFLNLLRTYPAGALHAYVFLTPVWGVITGVLMLGEGLTLPLVGGIVLVGLGLRLVNRPAPAAPRRGPGSATAG